MNSLADIANPGTGVVTLRSAIIAADNEHTNVVNTPDIINFSVTGTIALTSALPTINNEVVSIQGPGASALTVLGDGQHDALLTVGAGGWASVSGLTLDGNQFGNSGITVDAGSTLQVQDAVIQTANNTTGSGGAIANSGGAVSVTRTTFLNDSATGSGGAIANLSGSLTVSQSTFSGDVSNGNGGAIYSTASGGLGRVSVLDSTFVDDASVQGSGGALDLESGSQATVADSTFIANSALSNGGAIAVLGGAGASSALTLSSSTVFGNQVVNGFGAGLYVDPNATAVVSETIVAGNQQSSSAFSDVFGAVDPTSAYNLIGDGTGLSGISNGLQGNQIGTDAQPINPELGPLANNGGPTETLALLPGSPAIDAGQPTNPSTTAQPTNPSTTAQPANPSTTAQPANNQQATAASIPATDQRGFSRLVGPAQDIGAFEYQYDLVASATATPSVLPGGTITYTLTVTNNGPDPVPGVTLTDPLPDGTTFVSFTSSPANPSTAQPASPSTPAQPANPSTMAQPANPTTSAQPGDGSLASPTGLTTAGVTVSVPNVGQAGTVTATDMAPLAAGASETFTLVVQVGSATTPGTIIANSATFGPTTDDIDAANNTAVSTTTVTYPPLVATALEFSQQPASVPAGQALPTVQVAVLDQSGQIDSNDNGDVVSLTGAPFAAGSTTSVPVVNGIATFSNLVIDQPGTYTLTADDPYLISPSNGPLAPVTSSSFTVSAAASQLVFASQPGTTLYGQTLGGSSGVTVDLVDANGILVDTSAPVTLALGNNPGGGQLSGTLTVNAIHGVATFTDLSVSEAGVGYTLVATSPGLSAATSAPFTITGLAPGLTVQGNVLYVVGGTGYNWVQINPTGAADDGSTGISVQATLSGQYVAQNFGPGLTMVRLYLQGSGASVQMTPSLTLNAYISAGNGYNDIQTANGNETILTGNGGGYISAGDGNDFIRAGNGYNVVQVGNGNDVISVGDDGSSVEAGNGNDVVLAGNGYNYVQLGNGNDVVWLGTGGGSVFLGDGSDVVAEAAPGAYVQAAGSVNVEAGPPEDVILAALDIWLASGGSQNDLRNDLSPWLGSLPPA